MRKVDDREKKNKKKEKKEKKRKKIMSFIVATNVVASQPPQRRPTGTPTTFANIGLEKKEAKLYKYHAIGS